MTDIRPRDEGSDAACACLIVLHRHRRGLRVSDLVTLTGHPEHAIRAALRGLVERERVRCLLPGDDAWHVSARHAPLRAVAA